LFEEETDTVDEGESHSEEFTEEEIHKLDDLEKGIA
jgi:hypothetical protein